MPKKAPLALEISKCIVHGGTPHEKERWLLWSRKHYTGKRVQQYFVTRDSAVEERDRLLAQHAAQGAEADKLTGAERADAAAAIKILAGRASLVDAAKTWERNEKSTAGHKTVDEVIPLHLERLKKKGNTAKYIRAQRWSLELFSRSKGASGISFGSRNIAEILPAEIEGWLHAQGWEGQNLRNYARDVSMLFNHAINFENLMTWNPVKGVTKPKFRQKAPDILTIAETLRLLKLAPDWDLLAMVAIGLFAGIRVEELLKLRWEWFYWSEKEIRLPGWVKANKITKTGQPRNVDIYPVLLAWIKNPPKRGLVTAIKGIRRRREALIAAATITGKRNFLRHSFASHHAAMFRDPGALQHLLGQQTPSVLYKYYVQAVPGAEAKRYFALKP